jgi:hypothetical protein
VRLTAFFFALCVLFAISPALLGGCSSDDPPRVIPDAGHTTPPPARPITDTPTVPDPDTAAAPTLTKIEPASAAFGSIGPTIVLTGTNFVPRSVVHFDGDDLDTSFTSDTVISATLPTAKLGGVAQLQVTVRTPPPGGGESTALKFSVENPPPTILELNPLSAVGGSGDTPITVIGTTFVVGSTIKFGANDLQTTYKDDQHLQATIPKNLLATSMSVPISVTSPAPGGGTSTTISFTVTNPTAVITSISPTSTPINSTVALTVKGTGFVALSVIVFNGNPLTTTGGPGDLSATITPDLLAATGKLPVVVQNPQPGGGLSEPVTLDVQNPVPVATTVAPASIPAGSNPTPITVSGSNFVSGSKITVDGAPVATTFGSATQLKATLTAVQLAKVGTPQIKVTSPAPGGGTSNAITLNVPAGQPKVTAIEPSAIKVGSPDTTITIHGSLFIAGSTVAAKGTAITTTYANSGQLTAVLPAAMLTTAGPVPIVVTNAPPGGGSSTAVNVNVTCDTGGVNVILADATLQTLTTDFATAPLETRWASDGQCPNVPLSSPVVTKQPSRYAIVQNSTTSPITLAAWADCTSDNKGAAYMTFYRRATPPANDTDRLQCEGFVADGAPHASPDSGTSANCPGLTKANGGGITLAACERAIVHIQPFDISSTTFTAPPTLKVQAQ